MTEPWRRHGRHDRATVPQQQADGRTVWLVQQDDGSWLIEGAGGNAVHPSRQVMLPLTQALLGPPRAAPLLVAAMTTARRGHGGGPGLTSGHLRRPCLYCWLSATLISSVGNKGGQAWGPTWGPACGRMTGNDGEQLDFDTRWVPLTPVDAGGTL